MTLHYTADNGQKVEVQAEIDGVTLFIKDGSFESRSVFSVDDCEELLKMFQKAGQHTSLLNMKTS